MKKTHLYLPILFFVFFSACKKENKQAPQFPAYTCTTCKLVPDAIAANNTISKGIYKGVVLGSSGTIQFDIANNGTAITAVMVLDGVTVNLSSSVTLVNGQPYIADFTGILNGAPVSINFSVDLNGANPAVTTSSIPGHPNTTILIV